MPDLVLTDLPLDGCARLTLNRPDARNPTSIAMLDAMDAALDAVVDDPAIRVILLTGAGKAFCSGLDLDEVRGGEPTIRRLLTRLSEVMRRLRRLDQVTIAVVHGAAIGGGFGFMVACDFRLTHDNARLGYPPLNSGLSPALMAPWLMRTVGPAKARSMLLSGGAITGDEALRLDIATHLADRATLDSTAIGLARRALSGGAFATRHMKRFLNELDDSISDAMLDRAAEVSADVIASDETQARLEKMFEQRKDGR